MSRFAFALRPKWILGHLIVLALVAMFVSAGFWQLRRLHQRRAFNAEVAANMAAPVAPLDEVLPVGSTFADVPSELDRRVRVTGRYLVDQEVVIIGQASADSIPGVWLVTPLETDDGRIVLVNRGWVPVDRPDHQSSGRGPASDWTGVGRRTGLRDAGADER